MGTRASFFVGNPVNLESRKWLGCIAWDGYPSALPDVTGATTETEFVTAVQALETRKDFAHPSKGFPFPWADDLFLTDYTYAYFDGAVQICHFHDPFVSFVQYDSDSEQQDDPAHLNVPAPASYNPAQPDSIIIVSVR